MASGYAQNTNFTMIAGDVVDVGMLISNNAGSNITVTRNGAAVNLTGVLGIKCTAKYNLSDADNAAVFSIAIGTGVSIITAATGLITIVIPAVHTATLGDQRLDLYWDAQVTDSGSFVTTFLRGILTILPGVSLTTP